MGPRGRQRRMGRQRGGTGRHPRGRRRAGAGPGTTVADAPVAGGSAAPAHPRFPPGRRGTGRGRGHGVVVAHAPGRVGTPPARTPHRERGGRGPAPASALRCGRTLRRGRLRSDSGAFRGPSAGTDRPAGRPGRVRPQPLQYTRGSPRTGPDRGPLDPRTLPPGPGTDTASRAGTGSRANTGARGGGRPGRIAAPADAGGGRGQLVMRTDVEVAPAARGVTVPRPRIGPRPTCAV